MVDGDYTDRAAQAWAELRPDADLPTLEITMRLRRIVNELDRALAAIIDGTELAAYGDYQVLSVLRRSSQPMQPAELAEALQVTRSGTTGRLQRLEQLNLIRRKPDPDDARRAHLSLTPKGKRLADRLFTLGQKAQAAAFADLTTAERQNLADLLRTVVNTLTDTSRVENISESPEPL